METKYRNIILSAVLSKCIIALVALMMTACSDNDTLSGDTPIRMRLDVSVRTFDSEDATRASGWTWQDGATVYLQFKSGTNTVSSQAIYSQATGEWTIPGNLSSAIGTSGDCEVYFFDGTTTIIAQNTVKLGSDVGVYSGNGSYTCTAGVVSVSATLAPLTSRVRFVQPPETAISTISVQGIRCFDSYNMATNTLTTTDEAITTGIDEGYTSYIYGIFTDATNRQFTLTNSTDGSDVTFTRSFASTVFKIGKSGMFTIPTKADSKNWTMKDNSDVKIEPVDLGLPSGTLWANMNVGATKPEDYGYYFAWGETEQDTYYSWASYMWMTEGKQSWQYVNKYQVADKQTSGCWYNSDGEFIGDGKDVLEPDDDVATVNWGGNWKMPTIEKQQELIDKCTWTWTTQNGVNGYEVTGPNGNSIFLPAAGYWGGDNIVDNNMIGRYWSKSLSSDTGKAFGLFFGNSYPYKSNTNRFYGLSIRPVQSPGTSPVTFTLSRDSLSFDVTGGKQYVTVTCNTSWTAISSDDTWCTVSPDSGNKDGIITVTANENPLTDQRTAIITVKAGTVTKEVKVTQLGKVSSGNAPANVKAVDLGLPSGTLWANMNVGASNPEDYGDYFAWGETVPKSTYNWSNYKWMTAGQSEGQYVNKYQVEDGMTNSCWYNIYGQFIGDGKKVLEPEDDAAMANWGENWRMPTIEEQQELIDICTWTWIAQNGMIGCRVTGPNNNSIFLPAAGYHNATGVANKDVHGCYWSSSIAPTSFSARGLKFVIRSPNKDVFYRQSGLSVRPVQNP